jgi:hypothetical protein
MNMTVSPRLKIPGFETLTLSRSEESALKTPVMLEYSFHTISPALDSTVKSPQNNNMVKQILRNNRTGGCLKVRLIDQQAKDFLIYPGMNIAEFTKKRKISSQKQDAFIPAGSIRMDLFIL